MKELGISSPCKALWRPPKEAKTPYQRRKTRKDRGQRNLNEGNFGQAKSGYGLNEIKAKKKDTSESWIGAIFFIMNLVTLMKKAEKLVLRPFSLLFTLLNVVHHHKKTLLCKSEHICISSSNQDRSNTNIWQYKISRPYLILYNLIIKNDYFNYFNSIFIFNILKKKLILNFTNLRV